MNKAIELHDSTLSSITENMGTITLQLNQAYIHQSENIPGINNGTVWIQILNIEVTEARIVSQPKQLPIKIHSGYLVANKKKLDDMIPLPIQYIGDIKIYLLTDHNEEVVIHGKHIYSIEKNAPIYIEDFI